MRIRGFYRAKLTKYFRNYCKKKNFYEGSSSNHGSNVDEMEQGNDCVCFAHTNTHESTQAPNTHTHMHTRTKAPWHTGTPA